MTDRINTCEKCGSTGLDPSDGYTPCGSCLGAGGKCMESPESPPASAVAEPVALPMETAPRDGTVVRLLIAPGSFGPLEDSEGPTWTIGMNSFDHTEEDRWQFAGWDWEQDCFIEDEGKPIGWLPFHAAITAERAKEGETRK